MPKVKKSFVFARLHTYLHRKLAFSVSASEFRIIPGYM